jgi:glycosyltransferase involved in cell wall biosynthesis
LFDVLPAVFYKIRYPRVRIVAPVFHLIPPPSARPGAKVRNVAAWLEQRCMVKLLAMVADIVIVDNSKLVGELAQFGITRKRCYVTRMGVARTIDAGQNPGAARYDALFVGRLAEIKGISILLRAWREVVASLPEAKLALAGVEQPGLGLSKKLQELNVSQNVVHLDGLSDEQIVEVYRSSKLFVTASKEEGYGISVLEAFAQGKPAVTFDLPAFAEAFPRGREIVRGEDAHDFAQAVIRVLNEPERYARLCAQVAAAQIPTWQDVAQSVASRCFPSAATLSDREETVIQR